jgi:hypothetical protein
VSGVPAAGIVRRGHAPVFYSMVGLEYSIWRGPRAAIIAQ